MYTHLSRDDRAVIAAGLRRRRSYRAIAADVGVAASTVSREVTRNSDPQQYRVWTAHRRARTRRRESKQACRTSRTHPHLLATAEALLDPLISPAVIGHCLGLHHETLYRWVHRERPDLRERLPRGGRRRRQYGAARSGHDSWHRHTRSISERPAAPVQWEGDTIRGRTRARLLTHVDAASLYLRADRIADGTADAVHATVRDAPPAGGTATYDCGSEFALWRMIEADTDLTVYFAHPGRPYERPRNENTNERLRRVYPKRTDFGRIDTDELAAVVGIINDTPRKSRGWRTPRELFRGCCSSD